MDAEHWISDNEPSTRYPIYTRANAGEVMPDPVSPMTATLDYREGFERGWQDAYTEFGTMRPDEIDEDRPCTTGIFGGYLFLNMSMTRIFGVRCPGMTPEAVDLQYFGTMPGIPPYVARPGDEDAERTAKLGEWLQWVMTTTEIPELDGLRDEVDAIVRDRPRLADLDEAALVARTRSLVAIFRRIFRTHIEMSTACGIGIGTVAAVCQAIGRSDLVTVLVAGAGDVDSAAPAAALWELSRQVADSPILQEAFGAGIDGLVDRIAAAGDPGADLFLLGFAEFLRRHGCRGPNEWELRSRVWDVAPELPLIAVDRMRLAPDSDAPDLKHLSTVATRQQAAADVAEALTGDPPAAAQFEAGLAAALRFSAGRERSKTVNIRLLHEQRLALRELARRWTRRSRLDHEDQIFMLSASELGEDDDRALLMLPEVRQREAYYLSLFEVEPPFVFSGRAAPVGEWPRRGATNGHAAPGTVLTGIAGSAGRARGRARVVLDPSEPGAFGPGDVLIAPFTDPSWTPLFVTAAAVVVNVGAQITHAVIVSRELGIPCVVSVAGATDLIPDGAIVEVDGSLGTVKLN